MNAADLAHLRSWFSDYVAAYRTGTPAADKTIGLKVAHTHRVRKEIVMIAEALGVSGGDLLLAETMALLHDVGRFKQYRTYGTFNDAASANHAELGLEVLGEHGVFSRFSAKEGELIRQAIGRHNVRVLTEDEDERSAFFTKLLRDADKLDILKVFVDYYAGRYDGIDGAVVWGLPDTETYTPSITKALRCRQMADTNDMSTVTDFKLVQISWVFDLNFQPSFRAVKERGYVNRIAATLPQTTDIRHSVGTAMVYLVERAGHESERLNSALSG